MNRIAATNRPPQRRRSPFTAERHGQRGFTLIEVLLVVAISGLLVGPLLAWMVLVMRQQPVEQDGMVRTAQASLLRTHFAPDVSSAGAADDYAAPPADDRWATWRQGCTDGGGDDGRQLVVLLAQRDGPVKTIYSVAPAVDGSGEPALWRDRCEADTGELIDSIQVLERVVDDPARTTAECSSGIRDGEPDAPCRRISLRVAVPGATDLVELSATRRADVRSLDRDVATGNLLPFAFIDITRTERRDNGTLALEVDLSAAGSFDPDGTIVEYRWELPTAPQPNPAYVTADGPDQSLVLTQVGTYTARLTVVDNDGGTATTYRRIATVENRRPTAVASVAPDPVVAGEVLSLDASASSDVDGSVVAHVWRLRSDRPEDQDLEAFVTTLNGPTHSWQVPEWAFGRVVVELTVTDDLGAVGSLARTVEIQDPDPPPPEDEDPDPNDPDPVDPDPEPEPGAPVADFVVQVGSNRQVTFDASGSSGQDLTYQWNFGLLAGVGTGGPVITHQYPAIGTYTARLTVRDSEGRTANRSALVVIPGQPQAPTNVRVENGVLLWNPRPGARRYLVDVESIGQGCARAITGLATGASEQPRRVLPPNPCGADSTVRARVATESVAGGPLAWSAWINVPNEVTK